MKLIIVEIQASKTLGNPGEACSYFNSNIKDIPKQRCWGSVAATDSYAAEMSDDFMECRIVHKGYIAEPRLLALVTYAK